MYMQVLNQNVVVFIVEIYYFHLDAPTYQTTTDPDDFVTMIGAISVSGGGDCPELSIGGAILGKDIDIICMP